MTTNENGRNPWWITDAPDFTVAEAISDEQSVGISWPISGDATTITQAENDSAGVVSGNCYHARHDHCRDCRCKCHEADA